MSFSILTYTTSFTLVLPPEMLPWREGLLGVFSRRIKSHGGTVEVNRRRRKEIVYTFTLRDLEASRGEGPDIDHLVRCLTLDVHNTTGYGVSAHGNLSS